MVLGLKKLIFHFCSNNYFLHFVIFCQISPQSILCCLKNIGRKKLKPMVSETHHKREERCCFTASIFNLHPFLVVDSFSTKGQHSYFNHEKKQKYEKNTKFTFFHPTLTQFHGSPVARIHFFHIFKKNGPDVANSSGLEDFLFFFFH